MGFPLNEFVLPRNNCEVVNKTWSTLAEWRKFIICLDGRSGLGKSVYARYLAYRLNMPCYHLDEFKTGNGVYDHSAALFDCILKRQEYERPVIVEGLCSAEILAKAQYPADLLIRLQMKGYLGPSGYRDMCKRYEETFTPDVTAVALTPRSALDEDWYEIDPSK